MHQLHSLQLARLTTRAEGAKRAVVEELDFVAVVFVVVAGLGVVVAVLVDFAAKISSRPTTGDG